MNPELERVLADCADRHARAARGLEVLSRLRAQLAPEGERSERLRSSKAVRPLQARLIERLEAGARRRQRLANALARADVEIGALEEWAKSLSGWRVEVGQSAAHAAALVRELRHHLESVHAEMDAMIEQQNAEYRGLAALARRVKDQIWSRGGELRDFARAAATLERHERERRELCDVFGRLRAQLAAAQAEADRAVRELEGNLTARAAAARAEELEADLKGWAEEDARAALLAKETERYLADGQERVRAHRASAEAEARRAHEERDLAAKERREDRVDETVALADAQGQSAGR